MRGDYRFHNVLFGTVHKASGDHDQNLRKDELEQFFRCTQ